MEKNQGSRSPLAEVELAVMEEGREWVRQETQKRLQRLAEEEGKVSPPQRASPQAGARRRVER
jgi:hypothetical protein